MLDLQLLLDAVSQAEADGKLSTSASENLSRWITEPRYGKYVPAIVEHIQTEQWKALDDAFWKVLEFGTGGRPRSEVRWECTRCGSRLFVRIGLKSSQVRLG